MRSRSDESERLYLTAGEDCTRQYSLRRSRGWGPQRQRARGASGLVDLGDCGDFREERRSIANRGLGGPARDEVAEENGKDRKKTEEAGRKKKLKGLLRRRSDRSRSKPRWWGESAEIETVVGLPSKNVLGSVLHFK
ncbi:unnamed protein product [Microthlaspi erraticum]|uniref:Uncharacterized protein n=1 Tax=Microthlaspi erraticum TaxID=1685480 RepID=A0A6D2HFT7_9BRAS|nr:unnamed protein product [Microthlaspi erraticum]